MKRRLKVGAFVLESLTSGMYTNPMDALREYIQNSADSIRVAEKCGLVPPGDGWINLIVDPDARTVVIRDNGLGVHSENIADCLVNIGISRKRLDADAGFRGIGRLAGIAYCDRLTFRTSACGEPVATSFHIDCETIKRIISPSSHRTCELSEVVENNGYITQEPCEIQSHFFEVLLEGINATASCFLDWHAIEIYVGQVAPVGFDHELFPLATRIEAWSQQHGLLMPTVRLSITTPHMEREVLKPYRMRYGTRIGSFDIDIQDISFYPLDANPDNPFWIWHAKSELLGMIDDKRSAGMRFRKSNIAFGGPERVCELFPGGEGRLNHWLLGEIHVCTSSVIPNARRDGFEPNEAWNSLRGLLAQFIADQTKACHTASASGSRPVVKVIAAARATANRAREIIDSGFTSTDERNTILGRLRKDRERSRKLLDSQLSQADSERVVLLIKELQLLHDSIHGIDCFILNDPRMLANREKQEVLYNVLRIIQSRLHLEHCSGRHECVDALKSAILESFQVEESRQIF
jgi:molecular chaperone HtpG